MPIPQGDLEAIRSYADGLVPPRMQERVRIKVTRRGNTVTIWESQPLDPGDVSSEWFDVGVARMKYDESSGGWTLHWFDRNTKAHRYELLEANQPVRRVLQEIEDNATGIFWG